MAKLSMVQQFKNTINSIAPAKSIDKIRRSTNKRGNMEYDAEVIFDGHEGNSFGFSWDTKADDYLVYRSRIYRHDGYTSRRTEVFSPEYHRFGTLAMVTEFIKATWDNDESEW